MNLDIDEVALRATVDKDAIEITEYNGPKWSQHLRHHAIESSRSFFNSYGITSHSHSISLGVLATVNCM